MRGAAAVRGAIGPVLLALLALPFALYALDLGWRWQAGTLLEPTRIFDRPGWTSDGISLHMLGGAVITVLAPLQLVAPLRRRYPRWHRWAGRITVALALVAALGGLGFILGRGTIGGPIMDAGFALYGGLMALAAVQTLRFARARELTRHRNWALRLFVLAIASWIFRVHYGLWFAATGGIGSTPALDGPFDRVQVFAFYLPYLALAEWWIRRRPTPRL